MSRAMGGLVDSSELPRRAVVAGAIGVAGAAVAAGSPAAAAAPAGASPAAASPADLEAIRAVLDGIDDAVDAKDWARCRGYFTDRVDVDFAALGGGPAARITADELVGGWERNLYAEKASFHMRTNHAITVDGDRASVRSKGYAFNRLARPLGDALWEVWGHYTHRLVRTRSGWRCTAIGLASVAHARGNELAWTYVPPE